MERLLIAGNYHEFIERDLNKAIKAYQRMPLVRPEDGTGYGHLSRIFGDLEKWRKVIEINERLLSITPHAPPGIYTGLVRAYSATGSYEKAEGLLDGIMENLAGTSLPYHHQSH